MSLAKKAASGIIWNFVTGLGAKVVAFAGAIYVARSLGPSAYGTVAIAAQYAILMSSFFNLNLGQYIIAKRDNPQDVPFHVAVLHVSMGLIVLTLLLLFRNVLAERANTPEIAQFIPGLAIAMAIERVGYVPEKMLLRDLHFRDVAVIRGIGDFIYTGVSLATVWRYGGFAVVYGTLCRSLFTALAFSFRSQLGAWLKPHPIRAEVAKDLVSFGVPVTIGSFAENVAYRVDNILMGWFWGPKLAGAYGMAYNVADTPTGTLAEHIGDVLSPSFAKLEPEDRARAYIRSAKLTALIVFPMSVGLAAVAPTVVATFLTNPQWAPVTRELTIMLALLCGLNIVRPISMTTNSLLQSQRRPKIIMGLGVAKAIAILVLIFVLGRIGIYWVAIAALGAYTLQMVLGLVAIRTTDKVPMASVLVGIVPPMIACIPVVLTVTGVRYLLASRGYTPGAFTLAIETAVGALTYPPSAFLLAPSITRDFLGIVRSLVDRRTKKS